MSNKKMVGLGAWLLNAPKGVDRNATFHAADENDDKHLVKCLLQVRDRRDPSTMKGFDAEGGGDTPEYAFDAAYRQLTDWLCDLGDAG